MTCHVPRRTPAHRTLEIRGLEHHVLWWGPPSSNPVVLLHGFLDVAETWQFVVDHLPEDWSLLAFDWRGFGRTAWAPAGYWFPDYYADLEAMLAQVCPESRACLVGHSMGGNIALAYAGIRPERVDSVVNLEGFGLARSDPRQSPSRLARWLDEAQERLEFNSYAGFEEFARLLLRRNPRLTPERALFIARSWAAVQPDGRVRISADPAHKRLNPYIYRRDELEACWREIRAPVLMLGGQLSDYRTRLGADSDYGRFSELISSLAVAEIPGASHMLHHEQPQAVAAVIESFLRERRCLPGPGAQEFRAHAANRT
jgi:pimeloyl-ACP methyl ester carboxylesterase